VTETKKSWLPTRKWFANQTIAVGGWLVALIGANWEVTQALQITAVGIVVAAATSYWLPNESTPGGVARKSTRRRR
jgi:hypothetical protein